MGEHRSPSPGEFDTCFGAECKTKVLYSAWKGQLFIQGQQVCDIALRSTSSGSIPAELPAKLEIRYAIAVSKLRKRLPEAAFRKNTCAHDKVCHRGILFSFYDVEFYCQEEVKVHQLIKSLKEKDLALVKYLNDQGTLILLASSALLKGKDSGPDESSSCLQALFLISSQNLTGLTAKELHCTPEQHESVSQVTSVLPGLHYALGEAAKCPDKEGSPPSSLIELYIQDFAKLGQDSHPPTDKLDSLPVSFDLFLKRSDLEAVSEKGPPSSFSHLQLYFSDPRNYTLDVAAAVSCFGDHSRSSSSGRVCDAERSTCSHSDPLPPGGVKLAGSQHAAQSNQYSKNCSLKTGHTSDWTLQQSKRKSSRLLGAGSRKKWAPLKVLCNMESCKKQTKAKKKKTTLSTPSSKIPEPCTDSDEPTLKLRNLQCPLGGKRGAEVLSAEFVRRPRCELATSEGVEQKKPRLLKHIKHLDADKVTSEEKTKKKKPIKKSVLHNMDVISLESQREAGNENNPSDERTTTQDVSQTLRKDQCDSHALNMLADLALSSVNSVLNNNGSTPISPCSSLRDHSRLQKEKILHKVSDHEYHRVTKKRKGASLSVQTRPSLLLSSGQPDLSAESPSSSQERGRVSYSKKRHVRPGLTKPHVGLPKKTGVDLDPSMPSLISSEHSYASPLEECSEELLLLKGVHSPLSSKNGVKNTKSGPLVGKVLPFRHQQNICRPHKPLKRHIPSVRSAIMAARQKEGFSKFHKVSCCDEAVKVTCQWETEYLFSLDSKYTNNSLEKTVVRAVHGPWDISMTDDVEEMKLILHMWVALFYSKPVRSPTVRKVVEHSNPAKFVSLNSVVDPLGLLDDHGGVYSLEKCPADSLSESDKPCSGVEGRACPSSEKPLSCNELSSTSCIEDEEPSTEEPRNLTSKDNQVNTTTSNSEAAIHSLEKVTGEDTDNIFVPDPVISVNSLNDSSSDERLDECLESRVLRTDAEAQANQAVNFAGVPQSDLASVPPADSADKQVSSSKAAASAESQEIDSGSHEAEEGCCCQTSTVRSPNASEEPWLGASAACGGDDGPCRAVRNLADLSIDEEKDGDGESMELESIDLVLSESNDDDSEHRDTDLDEENEGLSERSCVTEAAGVCDVASLDDSQFASVASPAAATVCQALPKGETELQENQDDPVVSASGSPAPNQRGSVEGFCTLQDDQGQNAVASAVVKEDSPVLAKYSDLCEDSCISKEGQDTNLDDSLSWQFSPVHQTTSDDEAELPRSQENIVVSTELNESPNQISLIEDISQEDMADSALLPTCELHPVQNSMPTQEEAKAFVVLAQQLTPVEQLGLDEGVSIPKEEEGQGSIAFAQQVTLSEELDLGEGVSIPKEQDGCHLTETAPLQASESDKMQSIAATQEEQKPRQALELQNSPPGTKEKQSLGLNSLVPESKPEDENTGALSVAQEVGCRDDELNQITDTLLEDIRSLLYDMIDTVSALAAVSEETCSKENSDFNWMSSILLECVTPPVSDEESCSADPKLMANEHLKQNCTFVDQMTDLQATLQGQGWCQSTLHESMRSDQANLVERESVQENEAASFIPSYMEWTRIGTRSLDSSPSFAETALSKGKGSSASAICDLGRADYQAPISERGKVKEACVEIVSYVPAEHHIACSSEESDLPVRGDAGESLRLGDSENAFGEQLARERALLPTRAMDADVHLENKSLSAEDDQEPFGDPCPRSPSGSSCCMRPTDSPGAAGTNYVCGLNPEEEICGDWMYLESKKRGSDVQTKQYGWPVAVRKGDKSVSPTLDIDSDLGQLKYINFSVTKKHKDKTRTFNSSKRCDTCVGESRLINSLSRPWRVLDDPIRSTLDMECLRFHYKLKETLARNKSQLSTSSSIFEKDCSPRVRAGTLPLREAAASAPGPPARSQSPLLITVSNPRPRQRVSGWYPRISAHFAHPDVLEPPSAALLVAQDTVGKASRCQSQGQEPFSPFHLNKLTYDTKLKDSQGDISDIMDEFAELSRVMKLRQTSSKGRDPSSTSEGAPAPEKGCLSLPRRMASYEPLFTELCHTLHFRLKHVAKEACKNPYVFYLVETDDDPFFGRLKNLMKKGGHTEAEPLHFLKASNPETDRLKVIIRNEDIFSHIHKIPSLLRLKHLPNVTFVGVDSPEDALNDTCQELFHSGGFVVSDDNMLQAMTVEELKGTVKTLEKLNGHGRWRWLLHYKETKQLREETRQVGWAGPSVSPGDTFWIWMYLERLCAVSGQPPKSFLPCRVDSAAHAKDLILRSCQGANIMEVLHYHQCDSKSVPRSEYLKCLLNLQVQHIRRRFAVFLTGKKATYLSNPLFSCPIAERPRANREALESKGILALDVNTFIVTAQDMAAPFQSGC
ncbi:hypothetical protein lerEdw1_000592 [Lerista edwardsae]|nr:hypothetical protein lerEdw1_000592 [Lerista edwardsae]